MDVRGAGRRSICGLGCVFRRACGPCKVVQTHFRHLYLGQPLNRHSAIVEVWCSSARDCLRPRLFRSASSKLGVTGFGEFKRLTICSAITGHSLRVRSAPPSRSATAAIRSTLARLPISGREQSVSFSSRIALSSAAAARLARLACFEASWR